MDELAAADHNKIDYIYVYRRSTDTDAILSIALHSSITHPKSTRTSVGLTRPTPANNNQIINSVR